MAKSDFPVWKVAVVPDGGRWRVTKNGGSTVSHHRKKHRARKRGERLAEDNDAKLVIHRQNGTIMENIDYS